VGTYKRWSIESVPQAHKLAA